MLFLMPSAAAACADLDTLLKAAEADLIDLRMEDVQTGMESIEVALACGSPAKPEQLGWMFLLQGVAAIVDDDTIGATEAFDALSRIDPDGYRDEFGSKARAAFQAAQKNTPLPARLELKPELGENQAYLDGTEARAENPTRAGLHIVQLANPQGEVVFGKLLFLAPDQNRTLDTGVPPAKVVVVPDPLPPPPPKRGVQKPGWLLVSGVAAAAGAGLGAAAFSQRAQFDKIDRIEDLDRTYTRQQALGTAGYGLLGISAMTASVFVAHQF